MSDILQFRPIARYELDQHVLYLHDYALSRIAERFVMAFQHSVKQLVTMPTLGNELPVRRTVLKGIRYWPVKKPFNKYVIYYRIHEKVIEIIHILHGARDAEQILAN